MTFIKKEFPAGSGSRYRQNKKIKPKKCFTGFGVFTGLKVTGVTFKNSNKFKFLQNTLNEIEIIGAGLQTSSALKQSDWKSALLQNACLQGLPYSIWMTLIKKEFSAGSGLR